MKQCPNCAIALEDDALFCLNCGTRVPEDAPAAPVETAAPVVVDAPVMNEVPVYPVYEAVPEQPAPKKPLSKKTIGIIAIAAVAVAVIIFLIIGFSTNWFSAPLSKVEDALEKTMDANSFTVKAQAEIPGQGEFTLEGKVVLNREDKNLSVLADITTNDGYVTFLAADGKQYNVISMNNEKSASIDEIAAGTFDQIFEILDTTSEDEIDDETLESLLNASGMDLEVEEVRAFIDSIEKDCFENKAWLEEFMGYEKKNGKYTFDFEVKDVIKDLAERAYEADIITKTMKKQITSLSIDAKCEMEIELNKGYISVFEISVEINDQEIYAKVEFSDVNSTVITEGEVSEAIEEVEEFMAEYYANCTVCNDQAKKTSMREVYEKYYCYDCYYDMDYCDTCSAFVKEDTLTYIGYDYRCESCTAKYKTENYVDCAGCKENMDKNNMRTYGDTYYCSSCYYDRDECDICDAFVLDDELTYKNYKYYCKSCYNEYKADHTCDQCDTVVNSNYLCSNHRGYGHCDECGDDDVYIYYYNVQTKKHLCSWCD